MSFAGHVFDMIRRYKENREMLDRLRGQPTRHQGNHGLQIGFVAAEYQQFAHGGRQELPDQFDGSEGIFKIDAGRIQLFLHLGPAGRRAMGPVEGML